MRSSGSSKSQGKVYFIGFGPGDPELLTLKAYKILKRSDLIIYPGSLIGEEFLDEFEGEKINSHGRRLEDIVEIIFSAVDEGKIVSRIQSGDPSIFSAIGEQIREIKKKGVEYEVIPGVSSVFASSSAIGVELTSPDIEGVAIVRPAGNTLPKDHLHELARLPLTLVILLGIDKIDYIAEKLSEVRGESEPCAVVYHASREDERIVFSTLGNIAREVEREGIRRTATIIVGEAIEGYEGRSHLYSDYASAKQ
jgi:precorrin-4/cobalt-precorrin-4 C11-methyltransferase